MQIQTYHQWLHLPREIQQQFNLGECSHVPRINNPAALPEHCLNNAEQYAERFGGKLVFGWMATRLVGRILRLVGHVIVDDDVKGEICVSQDRFPSSVIAFCRDDSLREQALRTRFLPTQFLPLSSDPLTSELIEIELQFELLRQQASVRVMATTVDNGELGDLIARRQKLLSKIFYTWPINDIRH